MKKILQLILPLMLLFLVASCGNGNIELSYSNKTVDMNIGETISVKPNVTGKNVTLEYSLSSDIASIDNDGNLTANAAGQVVVTVTVKDVADVKAMLIVTIKGEERYTISFDVNGGKPLNDSMVSFTDGASVELPTPIKEGYKFLGWYENGELVETLTNKNYDLVAKWEALPTYTINWDLAGGAWGNTSGVTSFYDSADVVLPVPTKPGCKFLGWYENGTQVTSLNNKNYVLTAKWEELTGDSYSIKYDALGGLLPEGYITNFKAGETVHLPIPTKTGYKFQGWYENGVLVENLSAKNYNLVAKWAELRTFTIKWDLDGGTLYGSNDISTFKEDSQITFPVPTKEGYVFLGWYENGILVTELENKNYNLVARWYPLGSTVDPQPTVYTITYDLDGGTNPSNAVTSFTSGASVTLPTPTKEGYVFLGWYEGETLVTSLTNKNYVLKARWYGNGAQTTTYTIAYNLDGGTLPANAPTSFTDGSAVTLPTPTKSGYTFKGWYEGETLVTTLTNKNYTLKAKWEQNTNPNPQPTTYTITYNLDGGTNAANAPTSFTDGSSVALPTPTKSGYTFKGWYEGETLVTTLTNKNYTLTAKWEQNAVTPTPGNATYAEAFAAVSSDLLADFTAFFGTEVTKENCTSVFYKNRENANLTVAAFFLTNTTYSSKWSWLKDFFVTNGNTPDQLTAGTEAYWRFEVQSFLNETVATSWPRSADYSSTAIQSAFTTAYNNANGSTTPAPDPTPTPDPGTTTYTITYNLDGGANPSNAVTSFTDGSSVALPTPTKSGYTFLGWYEGTTLVTTLTNKNYVLTAKWQQNNGSTSTEPATVTFDCNGGTYTGHITKSLVTSSGTKATSLQLSLYNGSVWSNTNYLSHVFINTTDPKTLSATTIYLGTIGTDGVYEVIDVVASGTPKPDSLPEGTKYVITIHDAYDGTYDDSFDKTKAVKGSYVIIDKDPASISSTSLGTATFYTTSISTSKLTTTVDATTTLPTPTKTGYGFDGWYDASGYKYLTASDFLGKGVVTVTAKWSFDDQLIGSFTDNSWVVVGDNIKLNAVYATGATSTLKWTSSTPSIASVDQYGYVTGVAEGMATIEVSDANYPNIKFTFYVTVFATKPTGILDLLVQSNNATIYTRDNLPIGAGTPEYYYDVVGSVSKLLFTDYVVHKDYYLASPTKTSTLTGAGKGGIDFITFHYAADMGSSNTEANAKKYALTGGKNLASYNQSASGASWHYSTGMDGIWACQNTAWGAWHAGTSKTMKWYASGVTTAQIGTDIYTTDVTLGSDNYFYIKGIKTSVKNTTGYSKLNSMGLAVKLVGSEWYIGGCFYSSDYGYIGSLGGNNNSIGIESSVRIYSDLWLTWQYSAQLCAQLLLDHELPIQRLVGHHFFTGKDCPQPMLENELEIWFEFVEMVKKQMVLFSTYKDYTISAVSNSSYVSNLGRVNSDNLPTYSQCVTYTITYKTGTTTKTVTLSSIVPGQLA